MQVLGFNAVMEVEVHTPGYLRTTASFLPQTEKMAEKIKMGLEAAICFAKMYESGDKEDRVGMQITNPNLIVKTEPLKKRMYRNPKSPFKEVFEHHDLTWLWIGVPLALRRTTSYELLIVEYPHGDEVFNGLLIAFRFPPFLSP